MVANPSAWALETWTSAERSTSAGDLERRDDMNTTPLKPMTPDHEDWKDFVDRLERYLSAHDDCQKDFDGAQDVLVDMGFDQVDGEASLLFFEQNGASCDCEILMNIAAAVAEYEQDRVDAEFNRIVVGIDEHKTSPSAPGRSA
jgi:hypothetical protein